ncbi:hypothetical protein FD39_GL001061 [Lactobacillus amylolyticus DSM 11664]|nr:hypothetical protein FD39_GL001061 [Lactobacillus amylolyticus DSM 11664]
MNQILGAAERTGRLKQNGLIDFLLSAIKKAIKTVFKNNILIFNIKRKFKIFSGIDFL